MAKSRKSEREAKVERFTWFLMVLLFAILYLVPPEENNIPNWIIPMSGSIILLGSGIYQYSRKWRVSPLTWIAGAIMMMLALINLYVNPEQNFYGFVLLVFAGIIGFGVVTGET
ncbi:MAG: hypothetical protein OHK0046_01010 [Anaerolineae bacterium]